LKYSNLTAIVNLRPKSVGNISIFKIQRSSYPVNVDVMEKHPFSSQLFSPLDSVKYLAVVALGQDEPDLTTLKVFKANRKQAINYKPGVWHMPLVAIGHEGSYLCYTFEDGSKNDTILHSIKTITINDKCS